MKNPIHSFCLLNIFAFDERKRDIQNLRPEHCTIEYCIGEINWNAFFLLFIRVTRIFFQNGNIKHAQICWFIFFFGSDVLFNAPLKNFEIRIKNKIEEKNHRKSLWRHRTRWVSSFSLEFHVLFYRAHQMFSFFFRIFIKPFFFYLFDVAKVYTVTHSLLSPMLYFICSWFARRQNVIWNVVHAFLRSVSFCFCSVFYCQCHFLFKMCCFCSMEVLKHRVSDDMHTLYIVQFVLEIHIKVLSIFVLVVASSHPKRVVIAVHVISVINGWHENQCSLILIMIFHLEFGVPLNFFP